MLLNHLHHDLCFDLHNAGVVLQVHIRSSNALFLGQHVQLLEKGHVLGVAHADHGIHTRVNSPHSSLRQHLLVAQVVAVSIEYNLEVLLQGGTGNSFGSLSTLDSIGKVLERLGAQARQHGVHSRHVLARTHSSELEAVATVRERRSTVAVLSWAVEYRQAISSQVDLGALGVVHNVVTLHVALHVVRHLLSQVHRHDSRGGLASAQTEVVARAGNGHAHEVTILINSGKHSSHDDREDVRGARSLSQLLDIHQVGAIISTDRPVIVLARSVHTIKRLLVHQAGHAIGDSHLLHDLHKHHVLVNLSGHEAKVRGELVLTRGHLSMTSNQRNAHLVGLALDLSHGAQGRRSGIRRGHVVVAHLLTSRCHLTQHSTARQLQVGALHEGITRNEKELLFQTDVGLKRLHLVAQKLEQTASFARHGIVRAQKRGLFIQAVSIV
mmetsp:Transcript_3737/g.6746  ORF Transcript_3737/g.6746 Transcript_3737/m.6746 type:complete len:439 (-) Transcript_3737:596-1912(-)